MNVKAKKNKNVKYPMPTPAREVSRREMEDEEYTILNEEKPPPRRRSMK